MKYKPTAIVYHVDPVFYAVHKVRIKSVDEKRHKYELANGPVKWADGRDIFGTPAQAHAARWRRLGVAA